ncbi:MAG: ThuA domain-containing protein [Thermoguttaceae bacterium]|nr:ThuA domain-containing protein [Thermoguttaceae bacterium]MDW8037440.1 ThuA domain-containing protein [Thermoguttaceae bacterium]
MWKRLWVAATVAVGLVVAAVLVVQGAEKPKLKALIIHGQNGHDWRATTPVLKKILEETELFQVEVATSPPRGADMSGFKPNFAAYDVVISNYQGDEWPEETKKAMVDYVAGGGGLVIYHFALAAFPNWKEWNEMIGLAGCGGRNEKHGPYVYFENGKLIYDDSPGRAGGHGPMQEFALDVRAADHPIMQSLPPRFAYVKDELYGWLWGPAKNLTILATAYAPERKRWFGPT